MANIPNHAKERLQRGELALGMSVRQARTVDIASIARTCGFDWLWIDMEHSSISIDTAIQICNASLFCGITPIVRVPSHESFHVSRVLDGGAMGIIAPHVDTAEAAERIVQLAKFAPVGSRGVSGACPQLGFEQMSIVEERRILNETSIVVVQIESPEGVRNASEIAAIEGVDVLLVGANDLCASMGIDGQFEHPRIVAAHETVIAAARQYGKHAGTAGTRSQEIAGRYVRMGAHFVGVGSDLALLRQAARERVAYMQGLITRLSSNP